MLKIPFPYFKLYKILKTETKMTRILVENLNGLDLGGITTHIFNYISVLQRSSDYKIDIVVTVQETMML